MPKRDEIVADWRSRLETAAASEGSSSARAAWLARVRWRLYRFLLSLYGDGNWNAAGNSLTASSSKNATQPVNAVCESETLPLAGNPGKNDRLIRAVLQSVASAQGKPCTAGPLADGLSADSWVVAGAASSNIDVNRLLSQLRQAGITARPRTCGNDRLVEVHARDRDQALAIFQAALPNLRSTRRETRLAGVYFLVGFVLVALFAPLAVGTLLLIYDAWLAQEYGAYMHPGQFMMLLFYGWGACVVSYCCLGPFVTLKTADPMRFQDRSVRMVRRSRPRSWFRRKR